MTTQADHVAFKRIPQAAALAGFTSTLANLVIWLIVNAFWRVTIGWIEVIVFSVLGAIIGAGVYALLGRFTGRPIRLFWIISGAVLILYAFGPIAAAQAPYLEGAAPFNTATVIATELMHLVSGACIVGMLTQRASTRVKS
jgi:hypothetical protein